MKRIGLLGGMSWESSVEYYRFVNEAVRDCLGGLHSADCLLRSVDFAGIERFQREGRWDEAGRILACEAKKLAASGGELIGLCTNTMHKVAEPIVQAIDVPFVHIADATGHAVQAEGYGTVGLLPTGYTMEQDFYVGTAARGARPRRPHPRRADRQLVHTVIYDELCVGRVSAPREPRDPDNLMRR
jgi:aspartate racemase